MKTKLLRRGLLALLVILAMHPATSRACPFCSAVSMTLGEELKSSDAAVIATLVDRPAAADPAGGAPTKSRFKIVKALKGGKLLAGKPEIEMLYFGTQEPGSKFLLFGVDPKELAWGTPTALSDLGVEYVEKVAQLADESADRLAFFQEYFEDADALLSGDAFNEFAKAPYGDVVLLKDRMHRDKLIAWIKDDKVPASRRRLYLTMLGMCGQPEDVALIEGMIKTDDRQVRSALDAMIGCYLNLRGAEGLPLIEELFLKNDKSEYVDTYSAIVALRVLGQETNLIPKERLVASLRHMLDRPQLADLVIPDLARWQDWGAMPKLVDLFKNANEESSWVRVPVVQFLRACPDPKAQEYLKELAAIDPDAVKRATNYLALPGASGAPAPAAAAAKDDKPVASPDAASAAPPVSSAPQTPVATADASTSPAEEPAALAATGFPQGTVALDKESAGAAEGTAAAAPSASHTATAGDGVDSPRASNAGPRDAEVETERHSESPAASIRDSGSKSSADESRSPLNGSPSWAVLVAVCAALAAGATLLFRRH